MMKTYLGQDPDSSEAIEFLCLAEGGEVTHYEALSALAIKKFKNKQLFKYSQFNSQRRKKTSSIMYQIG